MDIYPSIPLRIASEGRYIAADLRQQHKEDGDRIHAAAAHDLKQCQVTPERFYVFVPHIS